MLLFQELLLDLSLLLHSFMLVLQLVCHPFIWPAGFFRIGSQSHQISPPPCSPFRHAWETIRFLSRQLAVSKFLPIVMVGMATDATINIHAPLAAAFSFAGSPWAAIMISAGSVTTLACTLLTCLMGQPRVFYQMALDVRPPGSRAQLFLVLTLKTLRRPGSFCPSLFLLPPVFPESLPSHRSVNFLDIGIIDETIFMEK